MTAGALAGLSVVELGSMVAAPYCGKLLADLGADPHVRERGVFETVVHPRIGEKRVVRPPWRLEGLRVRRPAPRIGEHTHCVLAEVLGLWSEEIERLEASGALH